VLNDHNVKTLLLRTLPIFLFTHLFSIYYEEKIGVTMLTTLPPSPLPSLSIEDIPPVTVPKIVPSRLSREVSRWLSRASHLKITSSPLSPKLSREVSPHLSQTSLPRNTALIAVPRGVPEACPQNCPHTSCPIHKALNTDPSFQPTSPCHKIFLLSVICVSQSHKSQTISHQHHSL
jgi:hypothetical protein